MVTGSKALLATAVEAMSSRMIAVIERNGERREVPIRHVSFDAPESAVMDYLADVRTLGTQVDEGWKVTDLLPERGEETTSEEQTTYQDVQPQALPVIGRQAVTEAVIEDLKERTRQGVIKYGRPLETFNGRNALVDAYQEALDLCQYLKQRLMEEETQT